MLISGSRISRWTETEQPFSISDTLLDGKQPPSDLVARAETALATALSALHAADAELRRGRTHSRRLIVLEAAVGTVGLIGLTTIACGGASPQQRACIFLLALAGALPIGMSIWRAALGHSRESAIVAAIENARSLVVKAGSLRDAAARLPAADASDPGVAGLMDAMLTDVEQLAAAAPGREQRLVGAPNAQSRRHVRIKPLNERIMVTRSDGVALIARLVDVSRSGAAISGELPDVAVGDQVMIGSTMARVVRALPHGIACEFIKTLPPEKLGFDTIL